MNLLSALFKDHQKSQVTASSQQQALACLGLGFETLSPLDLLAIATDAIVPGQIGHVTFKGVQWRAVCQGPQSIAKGDTVQVVGRQSNILQVIPY